MTSLIVELDLAGWVHVSDTAGAFEPGPDPDLPDFVPLWQNITQDEMTVVSAEAAIGFPDLTNVEQVRLYFSDELSQHGGSLISCDVTKIGLLPGVRLVTKYKQQEETNARFGAQLVVLRGGWTFRLVIAGSDAGMTGTRESIVFEKFASAREKSNDPLCKPETEFRYYRYGLGARGGPPFELSDDETYDPRFPDHPLSRIRKCQSREERKFQILEDDASGKVVTQIFENREKLRSVFAKIGQAMSIRAPKPDSAEPAGPEIPKMLIRRMDTQPSSKEEFFEVLGNRTALALLYVEVARAAGVGILPFARRQQECRERMDAEFKTLAEQIERQKSWSRYVKSTIKSMREGIMPERTQVWLARLAESKHWLHRPGLGQRSTISVFTSAAHVDDFLEAKRVQGEAVEMSIRDLFALLPELQNRQIIALEFNRCPRCEERRPSKLLRDFRSESDLADGYVVSLFTTKTVLECNFQKAQQEPDTGKRLAALQHLLWHTDPGAANILLEMARIAAAAGYSELLQRCRQKLAKYAPDSLSLAPE